MIKRNINLTLSPELWQSLENEAKNMGLGLATYIRVRLLNAQPQIQPVMAQPQPQPVMEYEEGEGCGYPLCDIYIPESRVKGEFCREHIWLLCEKCDKKEVDAVESLVQAGKPPKDVNDLKQIHGKAYCPDCRKIVIKFNRD